MTDEVVAPQEPIAHVRQLMTLAIGDEKHDDSSTSVLDALWVLYDRVLHVDPTQPEAKDRDRFILSKGHGPAAYYAVLAANGFFPESWLPGFMALGSMLGSHPDRVLVPGVEASTGSLGHGLGLGIGTALALRAKELHAPRVIVLCGDAELNEGSTWEAILLAPHLRLGNLSLLVIDNHSSSIEMPPWEARIGAFGWRVRVVDSHDHDALYRALSIRDTRVPTAVVADVAGER
jgi:transketolase